MRRLMRLGVLTLSVAALAVAAAGAAHAGQPVALKGELLDDDGRITLGELFDGAGSAAGVMIGVREGASAVLDAGRVQSLARAQGLDWANPTGLRRLIVRAGAPAPAAAAPAAATASAGTVEVLTFARSVAAGEIIGAQDVVWAPVQAHQAPADAPGDVEAVIGQTVRRPMRSGAAVSARDLAAPQVIQRDELIQVVYSAGGVNLVLQAKALENASVGEVFSAQNTQSRKTIVAVATGPGRAVVGPEARRLQASQFASLR